MSTSKTARATHLLGLPRGSWSNSQFWEAKDILDSTPDRDMDDAIIDLMFAWGDEEERRIESGTHVGPDA